MIGNRLIGIFFRKVSDTPEPPDPPVLGPFKAVFQYDSSGMAAAVVEGALPACMPTFDVNSLTCDAIYQRYRVYDPGIAGEIGNLMGYVIDDAYMVSAAGQYVAVTPYNVDETIKILSDWETDCTLTVGTDIEIIDIGTDKGLYGLTLLQSGRIAVHAYTTVYSDPDAPTRTFTFPIVDYDSPTAHAITNVLIDLDALVIDSNYHFNYGDGCTATAVNYSTGEIACRIQITRRYSYTVSYLAIRVNPDTGAITAVVANIEDSASIELTPLAGLSEITADCFDHSLMQHPGSYRVDKGSYNGQLLTTPPYGGALISGTFTSRTINTPPEMYVNFIDEVLGSPVNFLGPVNDKLVDIGYTIAAGVDGLEYTSAVFLGV